jgi:uncharacterized protein
MTARNGAPTGGRAKAAAKGTLAPDDGPRTLLFALSPAKTLDYETPLPAHAQATEPLFAGQSALLIRALRPLKWPQLATLMELSEPLARLNVARYKAWRRQPPEGAARPAVYAFDGDVYGGLDVRTLGPDDLAWAQQHLCLLSGLYGALRPLDAIQPHRLEMGTTLATDRGTNLYQFWGPRIAQEIRKRLRGQSAPLVVNLASQEYWRSVDRKALGLPVVDCVFEERRPGGAYKVISFNAKRARGLMARHAIRHRADTLATLRAFDAEGYGYDAAASDASTLVFRREAPPAPG